MIFFYLIPFPDNTYRNNAARVDRDPMTVKGTWNRWIQESHAEPRAGSQRPKDRHFTHMALMDYIPTSWVLSQDLG